MLHSGPGYDTGSASPVTASGTSSAKMTAATPTTAAPAAGADAGCSFWTPVLTLLAGIVAIVVVAVGAMLGHRWWIRRQNPALFKKYD